MNAPYIVWCAHRSQASIEEEHSDINSTLELPDVATVKTASVVDDTKSHISPSLSEAETPQLGSTSESLVTAPEDPPSIPATTESTEASLPRVSPSGFERFDDIPLI